MPTRDQSQSAPERPSTSGTHTCSVLSVTEPVFGGLPFLFAIAPAGLEKSFTYGSGVSLSTPFWHSTARPASLIETSLKRIGSDAAPGLGARRRSADAVSRDAWHCLLGVLP